jgi:hypothetical protein
MFISIYVTAILVSLILHRQERKHRAELELKYQHLGRLTPASRPKLPMLESWLNVVLGIFLAFGFGTLFLWMNFSRLREFPQNPRFAPQALEWEFASVILATGIALVILGIQSLIQNRRYSQLVAPEER